MVIARSDTTNDLIKAQLIDPESDEVSDSYSERSFLNEFIAVIRHMA